MADFCEHVGKVLLAEAGIAVPEGVLVRAASQAAAAFDELGECVVKAQVPVGGRGLAGGIQRAGNAEETARAANEILGMHIGDHDVTTLLIERQIQTCHEFYAAILNDTASRGPLLVFSTAGGMDVENSFTLAPAKSVKYSISLHTGLSFDTARRAVSHLVGGESVDSVADTLARLYDVYLDTDAELVEINPLAIDMTGKAMALDCKLVVDDSAISRQPALAAQKAHRPESRLETKAARSGLKYIDLDGSVGILANGAGLTMTTMDAVETYGGKPANFLEIGGEAYTIAGTATELLLDNPDVRSVLVNFCGAFARTDVMVKGVIESWKAIDPQVPVFFTVHGTGDREARAMIRRDLGLEPFENMDDAVRAAVAAGSSK